LLWQLLAIDSLLRIWLQQFQVVDGQLNWRVENQGELPPSAQLISSPYDIEARFKYLVQQVFRYIWCMENSHVTLTPAQVTHLTDLTSRGTVAVKTYRRALALLLLHQGQSYCAVARQLATRYDTVSRWATTFINHGLTMLVDKPRSGRPLQISGPERAKLTALACSPAPDGRSQWSLRLLAGKSVELGLCQQMSASSAHGILKKTSYGLT
jgi:putative transposase